jgi:hypothetical protein
MPINILMNSIVTKLLYQSNKLAPLIFNSDLAIKKQKELKVLITNYQITETAFIVVGTFLQNTDLSNFTKEELTYLLLYNYNSIEASKVVNNIHKYDYKQPLYDLDNILINSPINLTSDIQSNFLKLQGINNNLNLEYFINYLISQI